MKTPLQTGTSLFAYAVPAGRQGHAQAGVRVPVPPEKRFLINHIAGYLFSAVLFIAGAAGSMAADRTSSETKDAGGIGMIRYGGTPREFGSRFGELNRESLRRGQPRWLERQNVSREKLLELVRPMVEVVADIAPHWLEEIEAIAEAAEVDAELLKAQLFVIVPQDDCTTYTMSGAMAEGGRMFFHRTRDNRPGPQSGAIWDIDAPGVYKFMAVTYTGSRNISVMVNEKGLAASADMGGPTDRNPKPVGMMNGLMLRYIAEKAADSAEALEIVERFVKNRWYTRGGPQGTVWTFADRHGNTVRALHHSGADSLSSSRVAADVYSTRRGGDMLAALERPVSFAAFRNVSRDPAAKINRGRNSIAGMTISIHPEYPEFLTAVWFSFPAVGLAFPMYMGGVKTPLPLLDGTIYELGAGLPDDFEAWEKIEVELMMNAAALEDQAEKLIREGRIAEVRELIDEWSGKTTEAHLAVLKAGRAEAD